MTNTRTLHESKHERTPRIAGAVTKLLHMGATQKLIAKILCMSLTTLHDHYKDLLDTVRAEKNIELLDTAYDKATKEGNVQMLIYLLNSMVGLQEKEVEENNALEAIGKITMEILPPTQKPTEESVDE